METTLTQTPNQTKESIIRCVKAGLVPFVQSSPGIGKSSIVKQIAEEFNLKLIDHRLSTSAPEDLLGLPHFEKGQAVFSPFRDIFPLKIPGISKEEEHKRLFGNKEGAILFLDEFNSAPRSVQAAAYRLILDREIGQFKLHDKVAIVAAGNLLDDNAITVNLSTAMQSRLVHIIMKENFNEWLENVAFKEKYDERIIGFLSMYPKFLMDFNPESSELTFPCPRTWEFVNRLIKGQELDKSWTALLSGTISSGIAISFLSYCKLRDDMINIKDILKSPTLASIPERNETKWGTIFHLISNVKEDNFPKICQYVNRYSVDYRIIFYRAIKNQYSFLIEHKSFQEAMYDLSEYF